MSERKTWMSRTPQECDICKDPIGTEFVDGRTVYGPWACMCLSCHRINGVGLGLGKGQRYQKQDDKFVKVEG
jgi:hypothetical protein